MCGIESSALDESRFQRWFVGVNCPGALHQAEMMKRVGAPVCVG
jgi:hypothetical protein